jgi:hypothetical protein
MPVSKRPMRAYPKDKRAIGQLVRSLKIDVSGDEISLVDGDIPAGIARDSEVASAIAAAIAVHAALADPHPVYTTAAELTTALLGYLPVAGPIHLTGVITPAQIVANTDDYNPTGLATATVLRLSTDVSRNLTGIVAQSQGRVFQLHNIGAADLVLKNDATSTADNRFKFGADVTLNPDEGIEIWYDATSLRWRSSGKHT